MPHRSDRFARRLLVRKRAGGNRDGDLVVEGDQSEVVGRVQSGDQRLEGVLGRIEPFPRHRAAAVEDDLQRARGPLSS